MARTHKSDPSVEIEQCRLEHSTDDAILVVYVKPGRSEHEEVWVPRSVGQWERTNGDYGTLTVREWFAMKEEMI